MCAGASFRERDVHRGEHQSVGCAQVQDWQMGLVVDSHPIPCMWYRMYIYRDMGCIGVNGEASNICALFAAV